ncbi:MAG: ligase-associated DNA damage response DEXH box helicase [Ekhidna sp.]|nr:ligase-associated DNA damage response DEXH box helicase [Ekhidna sp.]
MRSVEEIISIGEKWVHSKGWQLFDFQMRTWQAYLDGKNGLLNAPTGSGKTYALWIPAALEFLKEHDFGDVKSEVQILWVTPLRALAKDIRAAMQSFCDDLGLQWKIGLRTGDTSTNERQKQKRSAPQALVITPESIHILLSQSDCPNYFKNIRAVIVDEWHELIGTKRGVAVELALSRIKKLTAHKLKVWGISATVGNLPQAKRVLLGEDLNRSAVTIKADLDKKIVVESILPDEVERFPWSGYLGTKLLDKVLPVIRESNTTLLFTNTRSQTELWYQAILDRAPDLAGIMAMHHGSMDQNIRMWVEDALHEGKLKLVVCTSSLDLGVDFRPVDTVIQIGGPKGVSRFRQRAGRSGHGPGEVSRIYFVPTHSLELIEGAALRDSINEEKFEQRKPLEKCMDVLVQYLTTLAVSGGFRPTEILREVKKTHCFRKITDEEWHWALEFITTGGSTLSEYDEYARVYNDDGIYKIVSKKAALRHKLSIGTIVGDPAMNVRFISGGYLGTVEESFVSKLNPGETFWFAGQSLEFMMIRDMSVLVKKSKKKSGKTPAWGGGRLPLSSLLSDQIRMKLQASVEGRFESEELRKIKPILDLQAKMSIVPGTDTLLIEKCETDYGHHLFFFTFEGMFVHEVLGGLIAYRLSRNQKITFSISMNDYGFELLSDRKVAIREALKLDLFSEKDLFEDLNKSINMTEMAQRTFRDVATIAGLIFPGYPGKAIRAKHLQASSGVLYKVFNTYDKNNLLIKQSIDEVMNLQLDQSRFIEAIRRINKQKIVLKEVQKPTPFAFPILVNIVRRQKLSTEEVTDRILKMQRELERTFD